nr:DUF4352 domain-containing protein [uncultured Mediterraneibacter sp.]
MNNQDGETKICKHCQSEIPKKAKVCPNCRKKQGGKLKWIILAVVALAIIGSAMGGNDSKKDVKKVEEVSSDTDGKTEEQASEPVEEPSNIFNVGDVVETEDFKITYESAVPYTSDNEFIQPKDGCEYWEFKFKFENISDTDQSVSTMMDWECYADNSKVDQTWIGDNNGLDAKLSAGRSAEGTLYFEVPENTEKIELEYDINFWGNDKIIFVAK